MNLDMEPEHGLEPQMGMEAYLIHEIANAVELLTRKQLLNQIKADPYAVLSAISTRIGRAFGVWSEAIERRVEREQRWPLDV